MGWNGSEPHSTPDSGPRLSLENRRADSHSLGWRAFRIHGEHGDFLAHPRSECRRIQFVCKPSDRRQTYGMLVQLQDFRFQENVEASLAEIEGIPPGDIDLCLDAERV